MRGGEVTEEWRGSDQMEGEMRGAERDLPGWVQRLRRTESTTM